MRAKSCLTRKTRYKKEQEISLLLFSVHTPLSQRRRWVPVSAPRIIGYKGGCDTCHFCGLSHFQWYTILGAFPVPISQVRPTYSPTAAHFIGKSGGDIAEHPRRKLKTLLRGFARMCRVRMARTTHRTAPAIAAAGGFPLPLVPEHTPNNQDDNCGQSQCNENRCQIFR